MNTMRQQGYSLLEITIVLAIITSLISGLIIGRSMIRTAQLRAVMSEYQYYTGAVKNFQTKYYSLPGDFNKASLLWGASNAANVPAAAETGAPNGDGDGYIDSFGSSGTNTYEAFYAWLHLGLAELINGRFYNTLSSGDGVTYCASNVQAGVNAPASKLKAAMWMLASTTPGLAATQYNGLGVRGAYYTYSVANGDKPKPVVMWLGGQLQYDSGLSGNGCTDTPSPVLTAVEAYQIDIKSDDGNADNGKIRAGINKTGSFTACRGGGTGGYNTSATAMACALAFLPDF